MFGEINVNESWRRWYNKELTQLYGDLDMLSFVGIRPLNLIGSVNTVDRTRRVKPSM
jgi:hypothetical protein